MLLRWLRFVVLGCLATVSWHCGKPSPICSERPDAACVTNQDCPTGKVCWQCECIDCPTGRLPCGLAGECIDVQENTSHCGGCGVICPIEKPLCKAGTCQAVKRLPKEALIQPGQFTMGSPQGELGRYDDELQHKVTLTRPYYIWNSEVTQGEYIDQIGENPSKHLGCADCPVEQVTWNEALQFCNALSRSRGLPECFDCGLETFTDPNIGATRTDLVCKLKEELNNDPTQCWGYRLPTEAEWEYAARADTTTATYNGDLFDPTCGPDRTLVDIAWYCYNASNPKAVTLKLNNAWGLFDMLGNVREWVWDWYGPYGDKAVTDPVGPSSGSGRVVRGGCWACRALENRAAYRFDHDALRRESDLGFRVVRRAPPEGN